jgi:hypothetical protein
MVKGCKEGKKKIQLTEGEETLQVGKGDNELVGVGGWWGFPKKKKKKPQKLL